MGSRQKLSLIAVREPSEDWDRVLEQVLQAATVTRLAEWSCEIHSILAEIEEPISKPDVKKEAARERLQREIEHLQSQLVELGSTE